MCTEKLQTIVNGRIHVINGNLDTYYSTALLLRPKDLSPEAMPREYLLFPEDGEPSKIALIILYNDIESYIVNDEYQFCQKLGITSIDPFDTSFQLYMGDAITRAGLNALNEIGKRYHEFVKGDDSYDISSRN